ncbi:MAG TPA: T9SS type A sorting domain-containing protein [Ignavibacteriaceae bacterium]
MLAQKFSLDKFNNDVYYTEFASGDIYIKNLNDSTVRPCPFPTLPVFANKSHKCVYGDEDSIFVYDFDTGKNLMVCNSVGSYEALDYAFSPNDEYVLFVNHYYSFLDSSLNEIDFTPDPYFEMEWVDETKFVWQYDEESIVLFDILNNSIDTVLITNTFPPYTAFAYNRTNNRLYYAFGELEYPKIHTYDLNTEVDSIVFNTANDTNDNCWWTFNDLEEMEWSPDSTRMAFFSYLVDAGGTIYTYSITDQRLYKYTNCGGEGYEYFLKWLNNDTIVYFNATLGFIYGLALDDPLAVQEDHNQVIPSSFEITAYPNPFNGIIHFNLSGEIKEPDLKIYSINGEEVARIDKLDGSGSSYTAIWNGKNNYGAEVSSGVYFVIIRDKQNPLLIKGTAKVIYLK